MTMTLEDIKLNHPKLHRAMQSRMRMMLLDPAFNITSKKQSKFRRMNLSFNEGSDCYTDFNRVVLGLNFPFFDGDINKNFNTAVTITGHENGHLLFTHQGDWNAFVYHAQRTYGPLANFAKDVLNILEDTRIEYLMGLVFNNLQRNFFLLNFRSIGKIEEEVNEQIKRKTPDSQDKILYIRNLLLYIGTTRILPNIKHPEIMEYLKRCYPYVLYSKIAKETKGVVKATKKILEILKPLIEEFKSEGHDKMKSKFKNKETGSYDPISGEGLEDYSDSLSAVELPEELEEMIRGLIEEMKDELEKEEEEADKDDDGFKRASSKDDKGKDDEGKEEKEGEGEGKGKKDDKKDKKPSPSPKKGEEEGKTSSETRDFVEDIANNLDIAEELKSKMESSVIDFEEKIKEPVTREILEDLLGSTKREKKQNFKSKKEAKTIEELDIKIDSELHSRCQAYFKPREKMDMFTRAEYEDLLRPLNPIIRKAVSQIREISQIAIENTLRNQRFGRLDRRSMVDYLAFNDFKVFRNKEIENKQLELEVMLLIDVSGSNNSQMLNTKNDTYVPRYVMNQTVAILLHEILKKLRFQHSVWTFDEQNVETQRFSSILDRSNCLDKQGGLYIKDAGAYSNNRDGYSIRYAGEYLNKLSHNPNRLLIVLSDGQPAAGGYYGHKAIEDVKQAVKDVEKKGSKVIGIFTGHESENAYFSNMYPNAIFCNNESIFDLPKILKNLLVSEFQNIINQTI